jgi:hypothetical protein
MICRLIRKMANPNKLNTNNRNEFGNETKMVPKSRNVGKQMDENVVSHSVSNF